jgi:tRNA A-37 threonylcarbamoyl transferase component Bud32
MIGPYRIERELGRGGMGVVFLAQDTRLGRSAAIKALPEDVAADPDRLGRFEREAKVLASLTHPNIAGIYGLEEREGRRFLALEYVEGESLADRLARGPLSVQETIDVGLQVAAGIEAAHEAGIIHRDLKPGNVVLTPADQAKVVDFGLAKGRVVEGASSASPTNVAVDSPTFAQSPTLLHSPTLQSPATMPGVILGTAAYLSPEQARGKAVDRRTDIWSFGCLLYECLTGRLAFQGETVSDTIAKILEREMSYDALPASTPAALRALISRCLEKDARRRLRDIGDARLTLEELKAGRSSAALAAVGAAQAESAEGAGAAPDAQAVAAAKRRGILVAVAAFLAGAVLAAAVWSGLRLGGRATSGAGGIPARLSVVVPEALRLQDFAVTRDGATIVALAALRHPSSGEEPTSMLYVRRIDDDRFEPLRGTERVRAYALYPDGKWVLYAAPVSERSLKLRAMKMPLDGSAPATDLGVLDDSWTANSGVVLESGEWLLAVKPGNRFVRIPAAGGTPTEPRPFVGLDSDVSVSFTDVLPGDRGVLLSVISYKGTVYEQSAGVLDLKSGKAKILLRNAGNARMTSSGYLAFSRRDALFSIPFDAGRLEVKGEPTAILGDLRIGASWANAHFEIARNGMLTFAPGGFVGKDRRLVTIDSAGHVTDWSGERLPFEVGALASPDGMRVATVVANAAGIYEIWVSDRGGKSSRRVIAREGADCGVPCWSPDGSKIAYAQTALSKEDGIYIARADGSGQPRRIATSEPGVALYPYSWTRDGSRILATREEGRNFEIVSVLASDSQATPAEPEWIFPRGTVKTAVGGLSPDNAYLAYFSDESGPLQLFVRRWNGTAVVGDGLPLGRVSGARVLWGRDSRRVRFVDEAGNLVETEIIPGPRLSASSPKTLWNPRDLKVLSTLASTLPDDRTVAIRGGEGEDDVTRIDVITDFPALLEDRMRRAEAK